MIQERERVDSRCCDEDEEDTSTPSMGAWSAEDPHTRGESAKGKSHTEPSVQAALSCTPRAHLTMCSSSIIVYSN